MPGTDGILRDHYQSMICPTHDDVLYLSGNDNSKEKSDTIEFEINKCHDSLRKKGDLPCAKPKEIEKFVKRVKLYTFSNTYQANIVEHSKFPAQRFEELISNDLFQDDFFLNRQITLRKNTIETSDEFFAPGWESMNWNFYDISKVQEEQFFRKKSTPYTIYKS